MLNTIPVGGAISLANNVLYITTSSGTLDAYKLWSLPSLTVTVPANMTEGDGTDNGTLSIPGPLGSALTVNLTCSDPTRLTVPSSVTIPAGATTATLPVTVVNTAAMYGPEAVSITAAVTGYNNGVGTTHGPRQQDGRA